jgi:hypothetical protein
MVVMRVTLLQPAVSDGDCVLFAADGGRGAARWRGSGQAAGESVDVEMDIKDEIDWREITPAVSASEALSVHEGQMSIHGTVEDVDQDGVLTLRIPGAVLLIDTVGEPPIGIVGQEVGFVAHDAEIYPTGI